MSEHRLPSLRDTSFGVIVLVSFLFIHGLSVVWNIVNQGQTAPGTRLSIAFWLAGVLLLTAVLVR